MLGRSSEEVFCRVASGIFCVESKDWLSSPCTQTCTVAVVSVLTLFSNTTSGSPKLFYLSQTDGPDGSESQNLKLAEAFHECAVLCVHLLCFLENASKSNFTGQGTGNALLVNRINLHIQGEKKQNQPSNMKGLPGSFRTRRKNLGLLFSLWADSLKIWFSIVPSSLQPEDRM